MSDYPLKDFAEYSVWGGGVVPERPVKCGLLIRCPNCGMRGGVYFRNVIGDPQGQELFLKAFAGEPMWDRTGDTLETMSLSPSVMMNGHFHSWVRDGKLKIDSVFSCTKLPEE